MSLNKIEEDIKNKTLIGPYLIYGKEQFLVQTMLNKIKRVFGKLILGLNYVKFNGSNFEKIYEELLSPPFGCPNKLVVVDGRIFFKKQQGKKAEIDSTKVEELASFLKEHIEDIKKCCVLVFVAEEVEKNRLYKTIEELGSICDFEPEKPEELSRRMQYICNLYGVKLEPYVASYFVEICGTNLQNLMNEIRKLIEYKGKGGVISKEDIDLISTKQFESVIFDLTDSLGQKRGKVALDVLRGLIAQKEPEQKILVTLYHHFKKLYVVKLCEKYKKNIAENLNLKPSQAFLIKKYTRQAGFFEEDEIEAFLMQMANLDADFKAGKIDLLVGLETIICNLCR